MIKGEEIKSLVRLLESREALLHHACQLDDLRSYLGLGGVPSRSLLESSRQSFTPFETDESDREKGVWDKVFVNMSDFGCTFAGGHAATPNPYGPILLSLRPAALLEADDVAICLRSAGARDFDREREALPSAADVERLFTYPADEGRPRSTFIKFSQGLRQEFGDERAHDPEVSVTVNGNLLKMEHVAWASVDPYELGGQSLGQLVTEERDRFGLRFKVYERRFKDMSRRPLYNEIAAMSMGQTVPLHEIISRESVSEDLKKWARQLRARNLEYQYERFVRYLREGTLAQGRAQSMS